MKKIGNFFTETKKELKKVRWPSRKEMVVYSLATIVFIIFFMLFFTGADILISGFKMLFQ